MTDLQILTLSLVQGITEFLPISSSGHLLATSKFFGWVDQGLAIDVAVHLGTLGAVLVYFFDDVIKGISGGIGMLLGKQNANTHFASIIIVATIPVVVVGYFLKDYIEVEFRTDSIMVVVGWTSIIFGFILWGVDLLMPTIRRVEHLSKRHTIVLGAMQVLALIPGVSRSGICMTGGRILGMERIESARISMLMGMPVLLAAGALIGVNLYNANNVVLNTQFALAVLLSFCSGLFAIRLMMLWFSNNNMTVFAIYRIIFGGVLLYLSHTM